MSSLGKWKSKSMKLKKDHIWQCKPGNRICVLGTGDVYFEIPLEWIMVPDNDSIKFYDANPPDDDIRLAFSHYKLEPRIDWSGLPLADLVKEGLNGDERQLTQVTDYIHRKQKNIVICWQDSTFIDAVEKREAFTRLCLCRYFELLCMITVDFWPEDKERVDSVWEVIMDSLTMGLKIKDPRLGY
jgi:hypothetical protein